MVTIPIPLQYYTECTQLSSGACGVCDMCSLAFRQNYPIWEDALDEKKLKSSILSQLLTSLSLASCASQGRSKSSKVAIDSELQSDAVLWRNNTECRHIHSTICNPPCPLPPHTHKNSVLNMVIHQKIAKKLADKTRIDLCVALGMKPLNTICSQRWTSPRQRQQR